MKRVKFVYNPHSGGTQLASNIDAIISLYQKEGYALVPYRLDFKGEPRRVLEDLGPEFDHMVIAGGDGTVNYMINLLKENGTDMPVAFLPAGTANDFATALGVDTANPVKATLKLLAGEEAKIDLGVANGRYFANVFSCGLLTEVSQKTPTALKNTFGKLAYYVEGLWELSRFRRIHVSIDSDGGSFDGNCVIFFVFNGQTAGNFPLAYLSDFDDGMLDVLILKGDNPFTTLQTVFQYMSKLVPQSKYPPGIIHFRCSRLTATCRTDETTDIDGQPGPSFPIEITCEKDALRVIKPRED